MSLTPRPAQASEIFISYSHKDQGLRDQLEIHLSLMQHEGLIASWHDRKIGASEEWAGQIDTHLNSAQIILLLVSPDFMASNYCYKIEMPRAMARYEAGEARVIPVILRPVDWSSAPFGKLQALPRDGKPITTWPNQDEAFLDVARGIRNIVKGLNRKSGTAPTVHSPSPSSHRSMLGFPPPTDPKTIQQRTAVVKDVYAKLNQPDIAAIVLTGIGGIGKSTLAALVYRYAEEQRQAGSGPFAAETLWLTTDPAATLVDLAGTLFENLQKPLPEFATLPPQNQAAALHNALNAVDKPRLILIDQFENLLDWQTGQALPDKPGVGEWLDVLNSQPSACRVLLTSRPWPQGTREYPPTCMQAYSVQGLGTIEGAALLRQQAVEAAQATDAELRQAVTRCAGHALSLTLLASMLRRNRSLTMPLLFHDPIYASLWTGNIARGLLDYIYTQQLSEAQRKLLRAFSVYRESVALDAAQALVPELPKAHVLSTLNVLLNQHLLDAVGNGLYKLHIIVAGYARDHFDESDQQASQEALRAAHSKAAQYYLQRAAEKCPPRDKRRGIGDVEPLVEATWQYCQAEQWSEAYDLLEREYIFTDVKRWGGNAILLDLYQLLLTGKWQPEPAQAADIYDCVGRLYDTLGKKLEALEYYEKALSIRREVGDRGGEGTTLNNLGLLYDALGNKQEALRYYQEALSIRREVGDRGGEGTTLWNVGAVYFKQVRYDVALACFLLARSIFEEVQSPDRDNVQGWIDDLRIKVGKKRFDALLVEVKPRASQIVEKALREGLR